MITTIAASAVAALLTTAPAPMSKIPAGQAQSGKLIKAQFGGNATCFKSGENQQGMAKICYYDCLGTPVAITIGAASLCPLTIKR